MFGPPGTGKTLCARAVANRTDACFIRVIGSELVQKYVGEVRATTGWSVERSADFQWWGPDTVVGVTDECTHVLEGQEGGGIVRQVTADQAVGYKT